jgi:hypothetical protein
MKTLAVSLALAIVLAAGCSKDDEPKGRTMTIDTPQGKVTYTADGSGDAAKGMTIETPQGKVKYTVEGGDKPTGMTIETPEGKATYGGAGAADLAVLEGYVYPGSALVEGSTMSAKQPGIELTHAQYLTSDSHEKVVGHYKQTLTGAKVLTMGPMATVTGKNAAGADYSITITPGEDGRTSVLVQVSKKD